MIVTRLVSLDYRQELSDSGGVFASFKMADGTRSRGGRGDNGRKAPAAQVVDPNRPYAESVCYPPPHTHTPKKKRLSTVCPRQIGFTAVSAPGFARPHSAAPSPCCLSSCALPWGGHFKVAVSPAQSP